MDNGPPGAVKMLGGADCMTEAQRAVLKRVLAGRPLANAPSLKRVLQYLCEHADERQGSMKEHDIAVSALGRPVGFDPKIDPIVRVSMGSLRERLQAYFEEEGKNEPLHIAIPKGQYRVVFSEAPPARPQAGDWIARNPALAKFWAPYLNGPARNTLVFSEVLFFRDDAGNYLRNIYVNDLQTGARDLRKRFAGMDLHGYAPSFHFVSAGEVLCMLSLLRLFASAGTQVETKNSRFSSWNALRQDNLILLGGSRINSFVRSLQGDNNFVVGANVIENREPLPGEEKCYRGTRRHDRKLEKLTEYALVTRQPGLSPASTVTIISANHGRAIEGAGDFLSAETCVQGLLETVHLEQTGPWPSHLQVLLRVEMIDFDEEVVRVEYVTHRIYPQ